MSNRLAVGDGRWIGVGEFLAAEQRAEQAEREVKRLNDERIKTDEEVFQLDMRVQQVERALAMESEAFQREYQRAEDVTAQLHAAERERDELRRLIETGASRGAEISPFIRRIFSVGSKAAAERDQLTIQLHAAQEALGAIMNELGVPQPGYPSPVINAYEIASAALSPRPSTETSDPFEPSPTPPLQSTPAVSE